MSNQNEIDIALTETDLAPVLAALATLETFVAAFPSLTAEDKQGLVRVPESADGWMANMLTRSEQNLGKLPRDFDPAHVRRDLALHQALSPLLLRLHRIGERVETAAFLARSDAFASLLAVRRRLKDAELPGIDDDLNDGLRRFFRRDKAPAAIVATTVTA